MSIQQIKHEAGKSRLGGASTWPPPSNASSALPTSPPMAMSLIRQDDKFAHRHQTLPPSARFVRSRPRKLSLNRYYSKLSKDQEKQAATLASATRLGFRGGRRDCSTSGGGLGEPLGMVTSTDTPPRTNNYSYPYTHVQAPRMAGSERGLGDPGEDHDFYGDGPEEVSAQTRLRGPSSGLFTPNLSCDSQELESCLLTTQSHPYAPPIHRPARRALLGNQVCEGG